MVRKAVLLDMLEFSKRGGNVEVAEDLNELLVFAKSSGISSEDMLAYYMTEFNRLKDVLLRRGDMVEVGVGLRKGDKIAYKEEASVDKVRALKEKGYSNWKIANELGISESTVYRRLKELKK